MSAIISRRSPSPSGNRHFAKALRGEGLTVDYVVLDDPNSARDEFLLAATAKNFRNGEAYAGHSAASWRYDGERAFTKHPASLDSRPSADFFNTIGPWQNSDCPFPGRATAFGARLIDPLHAIEKQAFVWSRSELQRLGRAIAHDGLIERHDR